MFTIVASRTTISCASPTTPSTHQRRSAAAAAPGVPAVFAAVSGAAWSVTIPGTAVRSASCAISRLPSGGVGLWPRPK